MAYLGRRGASAPLTSADIPAGIVEGTDVAFLENSSTTQNLSGTYSTERMYLNDSYQLTGDVNVTGHLALGTIADADVVITQDSTERTITGSGTLESGELMVSEKTDLTGMTGVLANSVQDNVTRLGTVTTGTFNGTLDSTTFSGDAGQKTAKAWVNFNGTGTPAIRDSFKVSSLTDHETGQIGVNFLNAMSNSNYAVVVLGGSMYGGNSACFDPSTTSFKAITSSSSAYVDSAQVSAIVFGD